MTRLKMKALRRFLFRLLRGAFRLCGGLHRSEHEEIVHEKLCKAEVETAQLRLYKYSMESRYKMLCQMLNTELEKNYGDARSD